MASQITRFLSDNFDNVEGLLQLVGKHYPQIPQREAVRKWFSRQRVSAEWWPILMVVLERERGAPVSLKKYVQGGNDADGVFG